MFYSVIVVLPLNLSFVQLYIVLFVFALIMWPEPSENLKMLLAYHNKLTMLDLIIPLAFV